MTDSAGKVVAQQRYTPLGQVRMASNAYGTSYSLTQAKLKLGKSGKIVAQTGCDPSGCSPDCHEEPDGAGGMTTVCVDPGGGGGPGGGGDPGGGGSSGGGSSGGGSSGGGSSGSGVDNYEPPPYTEPSANYYPAEQTNPPASDPVTDSNQQQDTASQVINDGAIENIEIAAAVVITAGVVAAVAIGSAPLIAAIAIGVAVAVAADTVYQVATTGEVDLTETAIAGAVGGVIGLAVGLVAIAGTAAVVAEGAAAAELETLRGGADIEKGVEIVAAVIEGASSKTIVAEEKVIESVQTVYHRFATINPSEPYLVQAEGMQWGYGYAKSQVAPPVVRAYLGYIPEEKINSLTMPAYEFVTNIPSKFTGLSYEWTAKMPGVISAVDNNFDDIVKIPVTVIRIIDPLK